LDFVKKKKFMIAVDILLVNLVLVLALWLRFDGQQIPSVFWNAYVQLLFPYTLVMLLFFLLFDLYNRLWSYASIEDLLAIVKAVACGALVLFVINYLFFYLQESYTFTLYALPRSVPPLSGILNVFFIGAFRLFYRYSLMNQQKVSGAGGKPTLIVGAGDAGAIVARELKKHNGSDEKGNFIAGFVDDDLNKQKQKMFEIPVLGTRKDIPYLVDKNNIEEIIIAIPSVSGEVVREIVDICSGTSARLKIVPGIYEFLDGRVSINQIREVKVEDLLDRAPVKLNLESIAGYLKNKVVLVTGAGGSIGSELCRQIIRFSVNKLVLLDNGENNLYEIQQELNTRFPDLVIVPAVADVKDHTSMEAVFRKYKPEVVFHAAAHKHVPLVEMNAAEAMKNNIMGTWSLARCSHRHGTEAFIYISTDKAVNPVSIMGATKRVAEMVIQNLAPKSNTRFGSVRFGNVLDSRGSVVPLFKKQIQSGGPVTVTHPEMMRYFMTIPEAVQLVIQAGAFADNGEVFLLDMGRPVKIVDLAQKMIKLAGFRTEDIEITFTGVRSGEKLKEELLTEQEGVSRTRHERIYEAQPDYFNQFALEKILQKISDPDWNAGFEEVVILLQTVLPSFRRESEEKQRDSSGISR